MSKTSFLFFPKPELVMPASDFLFFVDSPSLGGYHLEAPLAALRWCRYCAEASSPAALSVCVYRREKSICLPFPGNMRLNLMIIKWPYKSVGKCRDQGNFSPAFLPQLGFTGDKSNGISRLFCSPSFGEIGECYFLGFNKSILDIWAHTKKTQRRDDVPLLLLHPKSSSWVTWLFATVLLFSYY